MKRFLLFMGSHYYPAGGTEDLKGSFNTLDEAKEFYSHDTYYDWGNILDTQTGEVHNTGNGIGNGWCTESFDIALKRSA